MQTMLEAFRGEDVTRSVPRLPSGPVPYWGEPVSLVEVAFHLIEAADAQEHAASRFVNRINPARASGRTCSDSALSRPDGAGRKHLSENNNQARYYVGEMHAGKEPETFNLKMALPPHGELAIFAKPSPNAEPGTKKPSHDVFYKGNRAGAIWTRAKDDGSGEVFYTGKLLFIGWPGHELGFAAFAKKDGPGFVVVVQLPEREG